MKKNKEAMNEVVKIFGLFSVIIFWFAYLVIEIFGYGRIATIIEVALVTFIFTMNMVAGMTIQRLNQQLKKVKR